MSAWLFNSVCSKHADLCDRMPVCTALPREAGDEADAAMLSKILQISAFIESVVMLRHVLFTTVANPAPLNSRLRELLAGLASCCLLFWWALLCCPYSC